MQTGIVRSARVPVCFVHAPAKVNARKPERYCAYFQNRLATNVGLFTVAQHSYLFLFIFLLKFHNMAVLLFFKYYVKQKHNQATCVRKSHKIKSEIFLSCRISLKKSLCIWFLYPYICNG